MGEGLYGRRLEGYWMDVGTPERYLEASWDILERAGRDRGRRRLDDEWPLVEDGARVDAGAVVEPPALVAGRRRWAPARRSARGP